MASTTQWVNNFVPELFIFFVENLALADEFKDRGRPNMVGYEALIHVGWFEF